MKTTLTVIGKLANGVKVIDIDSCFIVMHNDKIMKSMNAAHGYTMAMFFGSKKEAFEAARKAVEKYPVMGWVTLDQATKLFHNVNPMTGLVY
jgi:F420-dependent methylenetetrahydromethanopterin dehydrogenase